MPSFKPPKMPHAMAPARTNVTRAPKTPKTPKTNTATTTVHANARGTRTSSTAAAGTTAAGTTAARTTPVATRTSSSTSPNAYTYGTGASARRYRAYGYGRGYRNGYNGRRYGYGRSQGNNRAVIARLRSAHSTLARIDHDYNGHRVRAMHQISMAIRSLSHRSMVYGNAGFNNGVNNALMMGRRNGGVARQAGFRRNANGNANQRMPQAMSDARMGQALRTLQGAQMQLSSQATSNGGHARARGHVQYAMHELNTALAVR
jgi:hypothetical protein